ncbi:calvin cycle protein CP12-2, chloroplastic-like [Tasmannia lanceolata]|uniref:calvin cycle protein CP12-2, chloroplastic-like n=1 Tax=Tasmannia lanceolata TaxID=3420 RepID=UPI004063ACFF
MATTLAGVGVFTTRGAMAKTDAPNHMTLKSPSLNYPWRTTYKGPHHVRPISSAPSSPPSSLSDIVEESVKKAEELCAGDSESGECAAAWDEVEEVSAAASHARDKQKQSDPLETYCKDNPETDECRTYED